MKILLQSIKSGIVRLTNTKQIIKLNKTSSSNHLTTEKKAKSHLFPQQLAKAKSVKTSVLLSQGPSSTSILNSNDSITFKAVKRLLSTAMDNTEQVILPAAEETAILTACREGDLERVIQLTTHLTPVEKRIHPALLEAIHFKQMDLVHYLLANNIGLRAVDTQGNTILHMAVKHGVRDGQQFLIEKLLTLGICEINGCSNSLGESLLHTAIRYYQREMVQTLIQHGIDLNIEAKATWSPTGRITPIQLAVLQGDSSLVEILLEKQASVTNNNLVGKSLLDVAVWANQIPVLNYLLTQNHHRYQAENIQQAFFTAAQVGNIEALARLERQGAGINQQDAQGNTALHLAVAASQVSSVYKLLELGVNVHLLNMENRKPVQLANRLLKQEKDNSKPDHVIIETYERLKNLLINHERRYHHQRFIPPNYAVLRVKNLVFQGGGVKGLAYAGSLDALEAQLNTQQSSLQDIRRVAGTSAGAITATLVAVGYSPQEIRDILKELELTQFLDHAAADQLLQLKETTLLKGLKTLAELSVGYLSANIQKQQATPTAILRDLYQTQGLCSGEKFRAWIDELLFKKTGIRNLTFGQLKELMRGNQQFKALHVVTTNLATSVPELITFNSEDEMFSHIGVADAVRASMSIPGVFKPKAITYRDQMGQEKSCYCVDGGLIRNFPVDMFDRARYREGGLRNEQANYPVFNDQTLGFSLYSPSKEALDKVTKESLIQKLRARIAKLTLGIEKQDIANTHTFVKQLAAVYFQAEEILNQLRPENAWRTIYINNQGVNTIDFDLSEEQKETLIKAGKVAVEEFYQRQQERPFFEPEAEEAKEEAKQSNKEEKNNREKAEDKKKDKKTSPEDPTEPPKKTKENKRSWFWEVGLGTLTLGGAGVYNTYNGYEDERRKLYKIEPLCPYFVKELQTFNRLRQLFEQGAQLVVISGMGGIGKTNLAREYARALYEDYSWFYQGKWQNFELEEIKKGRPLKITPPLIWEINGESFLSISQGFKALAETLQLDGWRKDQAGEIKTPEDLKRLCHQLYAKSSFYPKVILLFDNVIAYKYKINEQDEIEEFGIEPYLPTPAIHSNVQVLITSRREDFLQESENYKVLKLDTHYFKQSAQTLWQKIIPDDSAENTAWQTLLGKLDYLPLAVSVMAHYRKHTGQECEQILEKLTTDQSFLQSDTMQRIAASLPGYNQTVHAALLLSIEPIRTNEKLVDAWELLVLAGYVANYDIKRTLLFDYLKLKYPNDKQQAVEKKLEVALNTFRDASLLTSNDSRHESYEMHLLLQAVIRSEYAQFPQNAASNLPRELQRILLILNNQLNANREERYVIWRDKPYLIEHSKAFLENISNVFLSILNSSLEIAQLKSNLALVLIELANEANLQVALKYQQQALAIRKKQLGADHPDVATSYNNLALILEALGGETNLAAALNYQQQALAIRKKQLGADHPDVATSYNNLALILEALGGETNLTEALNYQQQAVNILRNQLDADHPVVATSYNNLASILRALGGETNLIAALNYLKQALAIRKKQLGADHPAVATSYNNLASILQALGGETNLTEALNYQQQAVNILRNQLGADHPNVAMSYNNLASILQALGGETNLTEALNYQQQAVNILRNQLDADHPVVATSYNNLASILRALGGETNLIAALNYLKQALAIRKKQLGADHPAVATSYNNLASILQALGGETNLTEALNYQQQAVNILRNQLGADHLDVATSYNNLAVILKDLSGETNLKLAYDYQQKALSIAEKHWGVEDERTKIMYKNMTDIEEHLAILEEIRKFTP